VKRKTKVSTEIPTASMADVAFLLLIFFLVTTHFLEEKGLGLVLPDPLTSAQKRIPKKNMWHFVIDEGGQVIFRFRDDEGTFQEEPVNMDEIRGRVMAGLRDNPNLIMNLKPYPDAPYGRAIGVLDQLRLANATRISVSQVKPEEEG
jgi:biopolymer transport protein ExbD